MLPLLYQYYRLRLCRVFSAVVPIVLLLQLFQWPAYAASAKKVPDTTKLVLSVGKFGIDQDFTDSQRYGVELRFKPLTSWRLIPELGYSWLKNGAHYSYLGVKRDFYLLMDVIITPSFAVGDFNNNAKVNLGHSIEFRSGLELSYQFYRQFRLGFALYHLSNAALSESNPGSEELVLSFAIPLP